MAAHQLARLRLVMHNAAFRALGSVESVLGSVSSALGSVESVGSALGSVERGK